MTFSLAIGIVFYQDAAGLIRLIESLKSIDHLITSIYAIDGRFIGPDFGSAEDPDLSEDLDFNFPLLTNKLKIISFAGSEWEKRQKYLEECYKDKPDFLLIPDTDEYLNVESIQEFENQLTQIKQSSSPKYIYHNVYDVDFIDKYEGITNTKPRVWFRPYQMKYINSLSFCNRQYVNYHSGPNGQMYALGLIKGISITHNKNLRSKEHEIKNKEYRKRLAGYVFPPTL
jgi:hypothetical protein